MALPASSRLRTRLAGVLPVLCLIHCIGTAVFAAAMPAAALWMRSEWLEGALTLLSAVLIGGPVLRRDRDTDPEGLTLALFLAAVVLSALGWLYGQESSRHIGLMMFVATQIVWMRSRRVRATACECAHHTPSVVLASD